MADLLGLRIAGAIDNKTGGGASAASQATVDAATNNTEFVSPLTLLSATSVQRVDNLFINPAGDVWQRTTNDTTVSTVKKYVSDMWHVVTGSGTLANVQRSTTVRSGALSKYSIELVGAAGVGGAEVGQRIESAKSARYKRTLAFSCYIWNGSGAAFTPKLLAWTPSAVDNWTTATVRNGVTGEDLQSCADAAWTRVTWSADVSGYTDIDNGFGISVQIPSGSLVAGDTVRFAEMNLIPGTAFPPMAMTDYLEEYMKCLAWAYVIDVSSNSTNQGQGAKIATATIQTQIQFPVPMMLVPSFTHNVSGYTAGAPGTTTVALINYDANAFFVITGALTFSQVTANRNYTNLNFIAGTSWNGAAGDLASPRFGPDVVAVFAPSATIF